MKDRKRFALVLVLLLLSGCSGGKSGGYAPDIGGAGAKGDAAQEQQVVQAVQGKINADADLKSAGIKVSVAGGQIELTGSVTNPEWKERAETIAFDVLQEKQGAAAGVLNTITVAESGKNASGN